MHFYLFEKVFSPRLDRFKLLMAEADVKHGSIGDAIENLESLVLENPGLRQTIRENVNFEPLQKLYEFRVLTGLQKPISLSEIKLPEIDGPSAKP